MKKFIIGFVVFSLVLILFSTVVYADVNASSLNLTSVPTESNLAATQTKFRIYNESGVDILYTYRVAGLSITGGETVTADHTMDTRFTNPYYFYVAAPHPVTVTISWGDRGEFSNVKASSGDTYEPEPEPIIPEPEPIIPEPEPIIPEPIIPEPCYCSLIVQVRDEGGHPINGAVLKVDGIEKRTVNGDARWDNLNCDTSYEVRELSPIEQTEGIHLGDCGERSTLRVVNEGEEYLVVAGIEEGELEVLGIMEVLPFTGPAIPYSPFIGISTVLAGAFLYILSKSKKKR